MDRGIQIALVILLTLPNPCPASAAAQGEASEAPGPAPRGGSVSAASTYAEGIYCESVTGDLKRALTLYRQVIKSSRDTSLLARATLRLGSCHEKLGQTGLARMAYRKVVDDFGSQRRVVRLARLALLTIGPARQQLDRWARKLNAEVARLKSVLEALKPGLDSLRDELSAAAKKPSQASRLFEQVTESKEMRAHLKHYLVSLYLRTGLRAYLSLGYERAVEDFQIAVLLQPNDKLARSYLEKAEFITGRREKLSPAPSGGDPAARLASELSATFELACAAAGRRDYRAALAAAEELLDHARWTHDSFLSDEAKKLLKMADSLAEECIFRLFPSETTRLLELSEQREELAGKIKQKLREALGRGISHRDTETQRRNKVNSLEYRKHHAGKRGESSVVEKSLQTPRFGILTAAIAMPSKELDALKIPFQKLSSPDEKETRFVYSVVGAAEGRKILSAAALAGPEALVRLPDMNLAPGQKGSLELTADSVENSEKKMAIKIEKGKSKFPASSAVKKERVNGDALAMRVEVMALKHTFHLRPGEYLVIGPFPNTLSDAVSRPAHMYLLLTPRKESISDNR